MFYAKIRLYKLVPTKIRLHESGQLPDGYNLGWGLDGRCCELLKIDYQTLKERVLHGGADEQILEWCFSTGRRPSKDEILFFNHFMIKRGWRDE